MLTEHTQRTTCMVRSRSLNFSRSSTPNKSARADIFIDNKHIELSLWDTAGQEEFDRLRSLSYDDTHSIMLCFSVDAPESLENVESKWVSEIVENCPGVSIVLVALKCDLRSGGATDEAKEPVITYQQGLDVAKRIQALRYLGMFRLAVWMN